MADVDVPDSLERKIGPLPAGVWLLAIGGGLALSYFLNRSDGGGDEGPAEPSNVASTRFAAGPVMIIDDVPTGDEFDRQPRGDQGTGDVEVGIQTNAQWERKAHERLADEGYDPLSIARALARYLTGEPVTVKDKAIIRRALQLVGLPPNPVPPLRNRPKPRTKKQPKPEPSPTKTPQKATPQTRPGFDYVRDNRSALFVVAWGPRIRYRLSSAQERARAREAFGPPLTSIAQTSSDYQAAVRKFAKARGFTYDPSGPIYLDARVPGGWSEREWTGQGIK